MLHILMFIYSFIHTSDLFWCPLYLALLASVGYLLLFLKLMLVISYSVSWCWLSLTKLVLVISYSLS